MWLVFSGTVKIKKQKVIKAMTSGCHEAVGAEEGDKKNVARRLNGTVQCMANDCGQ